MQLLMTRAFYCGRCWGCVLLLGALLLNHPLLGQNVPPRKYAVQVSATVQESPPAILLSWPSEGDAGLYTLSRRTRDSGWRPLATLSGAETSFTDRDVIIAKPYEYQIVKQTSANYTGYGYIAAGIRVPIPDSRGKVILLVENSLAAALEPELRELQSDLTGDGWGVIRRNTSSTDSPQSVKQTIQNIYQSDPTHVKTLFLLGHVPVPYSGNFFPDGHENHQGAWPADSYYADVDGEWTDSAVSNTFAERQVNWNLPGDGKFDQSYIPSTVELMVGRVDLSNLTCFSNKGNSRSELDLTRQYLAKNHAFRSGDMPVDRRGLICDNFSDKGADPISNSAWRNFPPLLGPNKIDEVGWNGFLPAATQHSYLWSYASGGGSYYYSTGVATSDDFALQDLRVVFTMFMGSYFGDWNNESNFLRAALGSGSVLTASYSGFPHTLYFPMALGEPIGYAVALTQNNPPNGLYPPWNKGAAQVHIALMGDPTLRMHAVKPPANLIARADDTGVHLSWNPSPESLIGYHVYRASNAEGPFTRLTENPVFLTSFTETPPAGIYFYMVRALKKEESGSGSYLNLSQGIFATVTAPGGSQPIGAPAAPILYAQLTVTNRVDLSWTDVSDETEYRLERRTEGEDWIEIQKLAANSTSFFEPGPLPGTRYFYRLRAANSAGVSPYSPEVSVVGPPEHHASPGTARFLMTDESTRGDWAGKLGSAGAVIPSSMPALSSFSAPANAIWTWSSSTSDTRALLRSESSTNRIASAWFGDQIVCTLDAPDPVRLALYFVDWDRSGRAQKITLLDADSGASLDSRELATFTDGLYLVYEVQGSIQIAVAREAGPNALLNGVFIDHSSNIPRPLTLDLKFPPSGPRLLVTGAPGQQFKVYSSADLRNWIEIATNILSSPELELPVHSSPLQRRLYFRAVSYQ